jgi:TDG/mug DNA glycosylase family protein
MKARIHGFAPVAAPGARILVLGTMPGVASLDAAQYYAHPRNTFWPIMGELAAAHPDLPYAQRLAALKRAGIALWDVLAACERPGSLDASIVAHSVVPNDIGALLARHLGIALIAFNGAPAEALFRRHIMLPERLAARVRLQRLPSTSPANASWSPARKLAAWRAALAPAGAGSRAAPPP